MFYLYIRIAQFYTLDDDVLLYAFLFIVAFVAFLNWMYTSYKKLRLKENEVNGEEKPNLENYTFAFNKGTSNLDENIPAKKLTIGRKIVMFSMALVVAVTPLYELIGTLKEDFYHYGMCCFC